MLDKIQPKTKLSKPKKVGRGGKRGKTSGRGHKGQKQHGGHGMRPEMRDVIKKLPKLRGYKFNSVKKKPLAINLSMINTRFENGETVNPTTLVDKKLISKGEAVNSSIKILAKGELDKKLTFEGCMVSGAAKDKILKMKGEIV